MPLQDVVSEGPLARQCFVNREEPIKEFLSRIHMPQSDVLFLYGEGGIGKSRMLDYLEDHFCRSLKQSEISLINPWDAYINIPAREVVKRYPTLDTEEIPIARLNFGSVALSRDPREAFEGLTQIRMKLKIPAERFQAACLLYLKLEERLTKDAISRVFPNEHAAVIASLLDGLSPNGLISVAAPLFAGISLPHAVPMLAGAHPSVSPHLAHITLSLVNSVWASGAKLFGASFETWRAKRKLRHSRFDRLEDFRPEEIVEVLPEILAEDLNVWLETGVGRFVLMLDSYQSFFGTDHFRHAESRSSPDWWLRRFLKALELDKGAIVVAAGQEIPRGSQNVKFRPHSLSYLTYADADLFLVKAGIGQEELRASILRYSTVEDERVQPFLCALLADIYRVAPAGTELPSLDTLSRDSSVLEKLQEAVERLISTSDERFRYAIRAMAAPRRFTWDLYRWVGKNTDYYAVSRAAFDVLIGLSCVRVLAADTFTMHALLRRAFGGTETHRDIHAACYDYYRASEHESVESLYHLYFFDEKAAETSWIEQFKTSTASNAHETSSELLILRTEIGGTFCVQEARDVAEYLESIGEYSRAEAEIERTLAFWNQQDMKDDLKVRLSYGFGLEKLADIHIRQGRFDYAERELQEAESCYEAVFGNDSDESAIQERRAGISYSLASICEDRSEFDKADNYYAEASRLRDNEALTDTFGIPYSANAHGNVFWHWADLKIKMGLLGEGADLCEKAVARYDRAIAADVYFFGAYNNKGDALRTWGRIRVRMGHFAEADLLFTAAENTYKDGLSLRPGDFKLLSNLAEVLSFRAKSFTEQGKLEDADRLYNEAIEAYDNAISFRKGEFVVQSNKGLALSDWAYSRGEAGDPLRAEQLYGAAVMQQDEVVREAPSYIGGYHNRAIALAGLGRVKNLRGELEQALALLRRSVENYDEALTISPRDPYVQNAKGVALRELGEVHIKQEDFATARDVLFEALAAYDEALNVSPDYIFANNNKGDTLQVIASVMLITQKPSLAPTFATSCLTIAVTIYDHTLRIAPEDRWAASSREIAKRKIEIIMHSSPEPLSAPEM